MDFTGMRVVVTGSASGIGRATAELLGKMGAHVHGFDITRGDTITDGFTAIDLRDPDTIDRAADGIAGPVDALFNCAGLAPGRPPIDVLKVNFVGTRHLTERILPLVPPGGAVINVSSNGGAEWATNLPHLRELVATPSFAEGVAWCERHGTVLARSYSASKEALIVWTLVQSAVTIGQGVRMNCTTPGAVQTPMLEEIERSVPASAIDAMAVPVGRRSRPEEQAWPLVFLASRAASYINGVVLPVDGGFMASRAGGGEQAPIGRK